VTRILLVRHGQSSWNASGRWQGWADPPLTELGRQQAWAAAGRIGAVDAIVASDLDRAVATAMVISEAVGIGPVVIEPGLKERDVGQWTGCTRAEIADRWPDLFRAYTGGGAVAGRAPVPVTPPDGEPVEALLARVTAALQRVAEEVGPHAEVLAISHGGVIRSVERHLGREPAAIPNLGALWVEVGPDGRLRLGERLLLIDPAEVAVTTPRQL
jgi:probable phosphoglycerate mutase